MKHLLGPNFPAPVCCCCCGVQSSGVVPWRLECTPGPLRKERGHHHHTAPPSESHRAANCRAGSMLTLILKMFLLCLSSCDIVRWEEIQSLHKEETSPPKGSHKRGIKQKEQQTSYSRTSYSDAHHILWLDSTEERFTLVAPECKRKLYKLK